MLLQLQLYHLPIEQVSIMSYLVQVIIMVKLQYHWAQLGQVIQENQLIRLV